MNEQYSVELGNELRGDAENQILRYQSILNNIQLCEELDTFDRDFVENELSIWLNYSTDDDTNKRIEDILVRIPFEKAYCYKNPDYHTELRGDVLREVFNVNAFEWRYNPELTRCLSIQDKLRIIKRFEYMCYYVINTREELLFDIKYILDSK